MNQFSNDSQPKIFVAGSSWARGEWDGPRVIHPGLIQYFTDAGYTVVDCSQARSYHSRVITALEKSMTESYTPGDIVLFILADPLLDVIMPELSVAGVKRTMDVEQLPEFTDRIQQSDGLLNLVRELQTQLEPPRIR